MTEPTFTFDNIHHIAIATRDWEASLRLYRDVLGLPITTYVPTARKIALLAVGRSTYIELFEPVDDTPALGAAAPNDPLTHFALRVDNVQAAIDHVRAAGYTVTREPIRLQGEQFDATIAFFTGPNGESIEFVQQNSAEGAV